ncbi:MAG TPA: hypothetical protein QF753_10395 [Victivallales bacterium]|nr:hypothetical protein [Victivallales bacterium]
MKTYHKKEKKNKIHHFYNEYKKAMNNYGNNFLPPYQRQTAKNI